MKLAMVGVSRLLAREFPESRLLVQVHDELLVEAPEAGAAAVLKAMIAEMERTFALRAPLLAIGGTERTWYDLK